MNLWPHQQKGLDETKSAIEANEQRICLTSPTGGGKSMMMRELLKWNEKRGGRSILFTNRTLLFSQTLKGLQAAGIDVGARAAGYAPNFDAAIQLAMVQTDSLRSWKSQKWMPHVANLVLIDEAHVNGGGDMQHIIGEYVKQGAAIVGFTATPLEIGHIYTKLIVAGKNSELRACGAHVPCVTYAPDEPDCRDLKPQATGEFSQGEVTKRIMTPVIMDRVFDRWKMLNPDALPTLGFAPGVKESIWFAEQFRARGIRSAHIDGTSCWLDGEEYQSSQAARDDIIAGLQSGEIKIIWNRFVLREGIDLPFVRHGIFATIFGALTSFLQSGGRLIRAAPGKDHVILQDHGGNTWRHGSLNADRAWRLDMTNNSSANERAERLRNGEEPEPIVCPQCGAVRLRGDTCVTCGFRHTTRSRMVIQKDGTLRQIEGKVFKPREIKQTPSTERNWEKCFWRCKRSGKTFRQAEGLFYREHGYMPPRTLPNMPTEPIDWSRKISDVPQNRLIPKDRKPVKI